MLHGMRGRSKSALQIKTRCCRYQLDQLSKCLIGTHVLHLHLGSWCKPICYSPDVLDKGHLLNTVGSFCSDSNSNSVNGCKQSNYSGLRVFLVNVPISRRWYCKEAIFSDWVEASYFVTLSKIFVSRKILSLRFEFILSFSKPSVADLLS